MRGLSGGRAAFCTSCGQAVTTENGSERQKEQAAPVQENAIQDVFHGNMPQGNMPQGNMPQGNMPQGNIPQGNMMSQNQVKSAQIFCRKCGSAIQEGMQHCTNCGAPVGAAGKKGLNILALICWAALLLSLFLPYVSASADILGYSYSQTVKLFDADDGIFFIIISIVGIVLAVLRLNKISIAAIGLIISIFWNKLVKPK